MDWSLGRSLTPPPRKIPNTAAASVDETIAPMSTASFQSKPISQPANATIAAVPATPTVANSPAGAAAERIDAQLVFSPPSSRISTSATVPIRKAKSVSSKGSPPSPSDPASMPSTRNNSPTGMPIRARVRVISVLTVSNTPNNAMIAAVARGSAIEL